MSEFTQLYKKNYIIWSRNRCGCLCEIITTIVFALLLVLIYSLSKEEVKPDTSYLAKAVQIGPLPESASAVFPDNHQQAFGQLELNEFLSSPIMKNCTLKSDQDMARFSGGFIALSPPENPIIKKLETFFTQNLNYEVKTFSSLSKIKAYVTETEDYGGLLPGTKTSNQICIGVAFSSSSSNQWEYNLMYNVTNSLDMISLDQAQVIKFQEETPDSWKRHVSAGIAYLINFIDTEILKSATSKTTAFIESKSTYVPTKSYTRNTQYEYIGEGDMTTFITFPVLILFLRFVYHILTEKEKKITQNLTNMGMSLTNYYISWLSFYISVMFVLSIIWTLIIKFNFFRDQSFLIIWMLFFMTGLSFIGFGMFIIAFFSKAKPGTLAAIIVYFVLMGLSIGIVASSTATITENFFWGLSPFAGLYKAGAMVVLAQSFGRTFGFELWNTEILVFKFSYFFWISLGEFLVLSMLGIYLDQVLPKSSSVRRHPLFCFIKRKKNRNVTKFDEKSYDQDDFEDVDEMLKAQKAQNKTLEIKNLRKEYSKKTVAVENLSLTMYSDQIFALLGHNGAGKTTTISMISGLLPITSGSISIMGKDTIHDQDEIKANMGVCPQTNPIYPLLTPREHLILYATVKKSKLYDKKLEEEIDQILKDIDLFDKKNYPAGKLSGGQKRKLCVACAFIGGSKVILLDEPSSGLDVSARRHLWEMLKKYKKGKIILLTTHYMDEADFLGDRIGVMGDGKLITCGSSLFLKNRFGVGYSLTLVKASSEVSTQNVTDLIKSKVPGAQLDDDISKEIRYILPKNESEKFEELFKVLETESESLGIDSFGVSLTTLEDVFLKVGERLEGKKKDEVEKKLEKTKKIIGREDDFVELEKIREKKSGKIFSMHFGALTKKRMIYFRRDLKSLICEVVIPVVFVILGILLTLLQFVNESEAGYLDPSIYEFKPKIWVSGESAITGKISHKDAEILVKSSTNLQNFDELMLETYEEKRLIAAYVESVNPTDFLYKYTVFTNTTAVNSNIVGLNLVNSAILKHATGDSSAYIKLRLEPLPLSNLTKSFEKNVDGYLAVLLIALAFSFIPSSMIMFIVKERENNAKHQQIVSGVSLSAYWFSNFLVDYLKYLIVAGLTLGIIFIFDADAFIDDGAIWGTIVLLLAFGLNLISFTYLTSFMFKSPSSGQVFAFVFSLMTGFVLMILNAILRLIESTRDFSVNFQEWVFYLFPMFDLCFGLYSLVTRQLWKIVLKLDTVPGIWSRYGLLPAVLFCFGMTVVNFGLIFYIELKKNKVKKETKEKNYEQIPSVKIETEDEDVIKEAAEVRKGEDYSIRVQDMTKVYTMINSSGGCCSKKMISRKAAVKRISFGVKKGECFGLLGTNGAGKTTTFKVLCGEIQPTEGFAEISGMKVATDMKKIRSLIGYCPQFDALLDLMTAREHLEMYAAIKGIPKDLREKLISNMIEKMNLTKYENIQAGTYSGGNKRKLSVAIALLGNPPIVFLDEPSSGMDPEARRFMWSVVGNMSTKKKASTVVLITHSMEEAEALSSKLAIMVEGKVKCVGPVQALKNKFGKGFEIETKIVMPNEKDIAELDDGAGGLKLDSFLDRNELENIFRKLGEEKLIKEVRRDGKGVFLFSELKNNGKVLMKLALEFVYFSKKSKILRQFLESTFGNVSEIESYQSFVRWKVEDHVKLSNLFGQMEANKELLSLSQYSVKQTTIEQIFINFAKEREVQDGI